MPNRALSVLRSRKKKKKKKFSTFEQRTDAMENAFLRALDHHDRHKRILVPSAGD